MASELEAHLGMPGEWVKHRSKSGSDHRTTKIGGQPDSPVLLQNALLTNYHLLKCGVCGGYTSLVAQVHAPLVFHGRQLNERTIYIFGCPAKGCGVDPACWRALRIQKQVAEVEVGNDGEACNSAATSGVASISSSCAEPENLSTGIREGKASNRSCGDTVDATTAFVNGLTQNPGAESSNEQRDGNLLGKPENWSNVIREGEAGNRRCGDAVGATTACLNGFAQIPGAESSNDWWDGNLLGKPENWSNGIRKGEAGNRRCGDTVGATTACAKGPTQIQGAGSSDEWWDHNLLWGQTLEGDTIEHDAADIKDMENLASLLMDAAQLSASTDEKEPRTSDSGPRMIARGARGKNSAASEMEAHVLNLPVLPCFYVYWQTESIIKKSSPTPSCVEAAVLGEDVSQTFEGVGEEWAAEEYEPDQALHVDKTYLRFKKSLDHCPEQCIRYCFGGRALWATEEENKETGRCAACGGPRLYEMQLMPPLLYFLQQAESKDSRQLCSSDDWDWSTLVVFTCAQSCSKVVGTTLGGEAGWSIIEEATLLQREVTVLGGKTYSSIV